MLLFGRRLRKLARASQDRIADTSAHATETLGAIHTVQAYAREGYESRRYGDAVLSALETARQRIRVRSTMTAFVIVLVFGAVTAVLWAGARSVIAGTLTAGVLSQFVLYAVMAAGSFRRAGRGAGRVQRAPARWSASGSCLRPGRDPGSRVSPARSCCLMRGTIRFPGVEFRYPVGPQQVPARPVHARVRARRDRRAGRPVGRRQDHRCSAACCASTILRPDRYSWTGARSRSCRWR
jgi:ATP-binding cassette subfamily B protein